MPAASPLCRMAYGRLSRFDQDCRQSACHACDRRLLTQKVAVTGTTIPWTHKPSFLTPGFHTLLQVGYRHIRGFGGCNDLVFSGHGAFWVMAPLAVRDYYKNRSGHSRSFLPSCILFRLCGPIHNGDLGRSLRVDVSGKERSIAHFWCGTVHLVLSMHRSSQPSLGAATVILRILPAPSQMGGGSAVGRPHACKPQGCGGKVSAATAWGSGGGCMLGLRSCCRLWQAPRQAPTGAGSICTLRAMVHPTDIPHADTAPHPHA